jgi:hypothetical protein
VDPARTAHPRAPEPAVLRFAWRRRSVRRAFVAERARSGHHASVVDVAALLLEQGLLLESARGPIPNVAELVAGEPIAGSWWGHPESHAIFDVINELADSPDVVRLRLVNGKITLVHRRVWPALVRVSDRIPRERLASVEEEHTASGAHRKIETPFPDWVPADAIEAARSLTDEQAFGALPSCLRPSP